MIPLITLEEHYLSSQVTAGSSEIRSLYAKFPSGIINKLVNLDEERIRDLDNGHVSLQVISHGPGNIPKSLCASANNELALAISRNPRRFAGFAALPMSDPLYAVAELERCVTELGFVGALVDNHTDGRFYDGIQFLPIFSKAQDLDVPIYIHPTFASQTMMRHHEGNYNDDVALALSSFDWAWHAETGLHILRLYASGLFDQFPKLKIIIGHTGEMLPFQLDRIISMSKTLGHRKRDLKTVWNENIWITTSGMFSLGPLACLLQTTSINHVLYSVDYPFSGNDRGFAFLDEIRDKGLMTEEELAQFSYKNAEALLRVKAEI